MQGTKVFFSSLGLLLALNLIIKPVWILGVERQVQNIVGTEQYGSYFSLLSLSVVFSFLTDWGFNSFINRELAANTKNLITQTGNLLVIKLLFTLIYLIVVLTAAFITGVKQWDHLLLLLLIQVVASFFLFFRSIITAQQWFTQEAWLSVLDKALMILACGAFMYLPFLGKTITINQFLIIQLISSLAAMFFALCVLLQKSIRFYPDNLKQSIRAIVKKATPYAIIIMLMYAHYRLDGFLLERLHPDGAYEAGIYAAAWRLLDAANMPGYLVASVLLPFLSARQSKKSATAEVILFSRHALFFYTVFVIVSFFFFAGWWQQLLYHTGKIYPALILQLCVPALFMLSLIHIYGTVLTSAGRLTAFCLIVAASLVVNILLNIILIPSTGAKGSCIAGLVSQGICGITLFLYANQKEKYPVHTRSLCIYFFSGVILYGVYYALQNLSLSPWLTMATGVVVMLLVVLVTGLLPVKQWTNRIIKNI